MKTEQKKKKLDIKKIINSMILFTFSCFLLSGCGEQKYSTVGTAMGTDVILIVNTKDATITDHLLKEISSLETDTLSYRYHESEIGRVNESAGDGTAIQLSEELNKDLIFLQDISQKSDGALDITIGPVARLWNIDQVTEGEADPYIPSEEQIQSALTKTGYQKITLSDGSICLKEGMSLDLGAVGKGIACDRAYEYLQDTDCSYAIISVGGSIATYGQKPNGEKFTVGIVNPRDDSQSVGTLHVPGGTFISTSGDYERYFEVDGIRYHHIIDPHTGYPADAKLCSVTIACDSGILSDALSTACFVLGKDKGMELAERYNAAALFIDTDQNQYCNERMEALYHRK